jgi:Ca2+/H+ antiporter
VDRGSALGNNQLREAVLDTVAPRAANFVLLLEIAMGVGLLLGAWLARKKRFQQHAWCQSVIVLLNFAVIVMMMVPSFRVHVFPRIPARLGKAFHALATAHAALGSVTEIAGLYILLAAGTSVLPEKFRITKYKVWMRSVLVLWWLVLLLGFATYTRWYVPHLFRK